MSISFVTGNAFFNAGSSSSNAFTALNVSSGDTIVVGSRTGVPGSSVLSVTDTAGNVYRQLSGNYGSSTPTELWYCTNCLSNASNIVTINYTNGSGNASGAVGQYRGLATLSPVDVVDLAHVNSGFTITSNAFTTTVANSLLICYAIINNTGGSWTPDTGWTNAAADASGVGMLQHKIVSSIQSGVTTTVTHTQGNDKNLNTASLHVTISGGGGGTLAAVF